MRVMNQDFKQKLLKTLSIALVSAVFSTVSFADEKAGEEKATAGKAKPKCSHCEGKKSKKKCKCSDEECKDGKCKHEHVAHSKNHKHEMHEEKKADAPAEEKKE